MLKKTIMDSWLRSVQSEGALLCCLPDSVTVPPKGDTECCGQSPELLSVVDQSFRLLKSSLLLDPPYCVAGITRKVASSSKQKTLKAFFNPLPYTTCCELFFIPNIKLFGRAYDTWFKKRLQWWMQVSIKYGYNLGKTKISEDKFDDSKVFDVELVQKLREFHVMNSKRSIVHCSFDVESTVAALLADSLQFDLNSEKLNSETATFNLDPFVVPYKVVVLEVKGTGEFDAEIRELCEKLCYSFFISGVSHVRFHCDLQDSDAPKISEIQQLPLWLHYRRMGVTRGVVVSHKTVQTGLVDFLHRNFDSYSYMATRDDLGSQNHGSMSYSGSATSYGPLTHRYYADVDHRPKIRNRSYHRKRVAAQQRQILYDFVKTQFQLARRDIILLQDVFLAIHRQNHQVIRAMVPTKEKLKTFLQSFGDEFSFCLVDRFTKEAVRWDTSSNTRKRKRACSSDDSSDYDDASSQPAYNLALETKTEIKILVAFQKANANELTLKELMRYLQPPYADYRILTYMGSSKRRVRKFLELRSHLLFVTEAENVYLRSKRHIKTVLELNNILCNKGTLCVEDALTQFNSTSSISYNIRRFLDMIRSHPWHFQVNEDDKNVTVSAFRALPAYNVIFVPIEGRSDSECSDIEGEKTEQLKKSDNGCEMKMKDDEEDNKEDN
ncbi:unnamed protein product [Soboliphyme baturini]|uniref:NARG2_C domain-containing protein n=1 Tax=Soboliphyme baturini TaxID=241478 RepID=A0A183IAT0_9BILA|nr:unnamed protein product [Soboliphyme baturini]